VRKELIEKQLEVEYKEKYLRKAGVLHQHKQRQMKKEEQEHFVNNFAQAKNLIEKQMKMGMQIRERNRIKKENKTRIEQTKLNKSVVPVRNQVKSVLFDTSFVAA